MVNTNNNNQGKTMRTAVKGSDCATDGYLEPATPLAKVGVAISAGRSTLNVVLASPASRISKIAVRIATVRFLEDRFSFRFIIRSLDAIK